MLSGAQALSREPVEDARDVHGGPHVPGINRGPDKAHLKPWFGHTVQNRDADRNVCAE